MNNFFQLLDKHKWKIATAESCTGGVIAASITDYAGSSAYFERGFVTYSNEAKMEQLDVNPITLQAFGAVSEQCARLMARGAYAHSLADIAISVTGTKNMERKRYIFGDEALTFLRHQWIPRIHIKI